MATIIEATWNYIRGRKRAYLQTFGNPVGEQVLRDLAKFCRADATCFHADPRVHAALEGRREVFLRIAQHMHLTTDELYRLHGGLKMEN